VVGDSAVRLSVPDLGWTVPRTGLLRALVQSRPSCVLLTGPSGYGKTVLALQFAQSERFQTVLWLDANGQVLDYCQILHLVLDAHRQQDRSGPESDVLLPSMPPAALEDDLEKVLGEHWGSSTCLVLDNLAPESEQPSLQQVQALLRRAVSADACVVGTARGIGKAVSGDADVWLLEADDLRLTDEEAISYAETVCGDTLGVDTVRHLLRVCSGHAALFAVLLRHSQLRRPPSSNTGDGNAPQSHHLTQQLERLVRSLDEQEQRILLAASLMRHGTRSDLESVLRFALTDGQLTQLAQCIPLFRLGADPHGLPEFRVHDLAREALGQCNGMDPKELGELVGLLLQHLSSKREYVTLFELAIAHAELVDVPDWLERCGGCLLDAGGLVLLERVLDTVSTAVLVQRPRLLLLKAQLENSRGDLLEASSKARLAAELAEYSGDSRTTTSARLLLGRLLLTSGRASEARRVLESVVSEPLRPDDEDTRSLLLAHLALASTQLGDTAAAQRYFEMIPDDDCRGAQPSRARFYVRMLRAYNMCVLQGDYRAAASLLASRTREMPIDIRIPTIGNAALASCYLGELARAQALVAEGLELIDETGAEGWRFATMGNRAAILAGLGDYDGAERDLLDLDNCRSELDEADLHYNLPLRSAWRRAAGDLDGALSDSERARAYFQSMEKFDARWLAEIESAANLLALGDRVASELSARRALDAVIPASANALGLLGRLVVAESSRQGGQIDEAVQCVSASARRILSGNGNWHIAMYVRAFPGLLGIIAAAVGPDRIPALLLRMVLPENAEKALALAREVLPEEGWRCLAGRLLGEEEIDKLGSETETPSACRVRLFGGLEVLAGERRIADTAWRKRKARLLFAMLVVRKGRDVPREQLLEYLWPDMDAERAVANFYVIWNNMKAALCPDLPKGQPLPYARTSGGVCRMDDLLVTSDLDEFERSLSEARRAETAGDRETQVAAFRRLAEIYRGDLLPGDIYDDWFAPLRERCRQEFGDAMLRAGRMLAEGGDQIGALEMIRAALTHDAWREDLYQAALRYQIDAGQRSAAIDTYMTCMHKLSEDLGIDPSAETKRLYGQVLAMEGPAEDGYPA
jgi:DNA-binding SARP family transcriptional activator/ATP/maltotriose-dependent transcriptional regulator MalT